MGMLYHASKKELKCQTKESYINAASTLKLNETIMLSLGTLCKFIEVEGSVKLMDPALVMLVGVESVVFEA